MSVLLSAILLLTSPAAPAQQRFASNVAHTYGDEDAEHRGVFAAATELPPNITMPDAYDALVETMFRSSPTFRAQCTRIALARHIQVLVQRSLLAPAQSAMTRIDRQAGGRLEARVDVSPFGDAVTLIAHEFEHIIEQLDDIDLAAMATRPDTGVRLDPRSGHFETERAIAVGQRVAREVVGTVARR